MRQRFSAPQWAKWFEEFDNSGLTVKEFCRRKHVSQNAFYQWRRRLNLPLPTKDHGLFVPVALQVENEVQIEMPCGAIVRLPNDPNSLRPVLETLLQIGTQKS